MFDIIKKIRHSLVYKLIISVGIILLLTISTWAYFGIAYQKERLRNDVIGHAERLGNMIILGTHYAMMLNSRNDINQIITNLGRQKELENIRIYNKRAEIKFSDDPAEIDLATDIESEACQVCHRFDPPPVTSSLEQRTRIFADPDGNRLLGVISPIYNSPGCSAGACHFHLPGQKILGALDVVVSLKQTEKEIEILRNGILVLAAIAFLVTSAIIFLFVLRFVNRPVRRLIAGTQAISGGDYQVEVAVNQDDEMSQLASAITRMGRKIGEKQKQLNCQRDEYQGLFETVPCIISVQDRNYKLVSYNREFAERFDPDPGDYCFHAYKGRSEKCPNCPVEKTFTDGKAHYSEEVGISKDGLPTYWLVKTSPIKNEEGEVVAAMEMNLDITHRKQLEDQLEISEKKYHDIFNNIPNPVFVLETETLAVLNCNDRVKNVYGYERDELIRRSFLDLFREEERSRYADRLKNAHVLNQVRQLTKDENTIFVDIWISPSHYLQKEVLLVTTSDITKRLEAEQQLIQASKMATLGEMATGVAHELNQPLAVIKTASNFFMKKVRHQEAIDPDILGEMAAEIDSHVDRAAKIINHMRQFGRMSDHRLQGVEVNSVLESTFEIFSQQLKVRGIDVIWELAENLPLILADADRLEQVFINLLINARDAIESRWGTQTPQAVEKTITLSTSCDQTNVYVRVTDTGAGIPRRALGRIFEPFFTTKEVGKGTGLGLSISYRIVQDFGGSIQAISTEAHGAVFLLTFPISKSS